MKVYHSSQNRRQFIRSTLRLTVLGGLTYLGFDLGKRKHGNNQASQKCQVQGPCTCCSDLTSCRIPKALLYKNQQKNINEIHVKKKG